MKAEFWHERWRQGQIGFHQGQVNAHLKSHWSAIGAEAGQSVFVPLCGKTHDLAWLRDQGHPVIGVELSEVAARDFFVERGIQAECRSDRRFRRFRRYQHGGIDILCGDFFALTAADLQHIGAFYDRAALIAMPPEMRAAYAAQMAAIIPPAARGLLITLDYPDGEMQGPPFNVSDQEVRELFEPDFTIQHLLTRTIPSDDPLSKRGLRNGSESLFQLTKKGT